MNYFDNAAAYLRKHHWIRGTVYDPPTGRVCAQGAFYHANGSDYGDGGAQQRAAYHWLNRFVNARYHVVPDFMLAATDIVPCWNDKFADGEEQVIAMFEAASEAWELEQSLAAPAAVPDPAEVMAFHVPMLSSLMQVVDAPEPPLPRYMTFTKVTTVLQPA